ncbi:terminase small subunit [Streptobacillus moniliformis]|uniref:terminase small subunit n=1 Tax=Streptobacillus moniliformis TaxID=34105 RepID=UPI000A9C1D2D|nr:terminase small subunit [Streptobacillus moniliformis]
MKNNNKSPVKLSLKQKKFCEYYISSGNGTEAAIKAGYSKKTATVIANENLMKPYIKEYIQEITEKMEADNIATATEIQTYLTAVMRGELDEEYTVFEKKGDGTEKAKKMKRKIQVRDRTKGAELLAKMKGLFIDKQENKTENKVIIISGEDELED